MTQQQTLQLFLPILIILPVLYLRMRRLGTARPLKLGQLWIRPALILLAAGLVVFLPQPGTHIMRHFLAQDWVWLALAAGLGGIAGWQWGRTMAIEVHPEEGTLMVKGGQAAILANQLRFVSIWAGPAGILPYKGLTCVQEQTSAEATELAVWKELRAAGPPMDKLEDTEDKLAHAMDSQGLGFWLNQAMRYSRACG